MTKLELKSVTLNILINLFYIKIYKNLSTKYYQENKERLQKKLLKDIKIFLNKKKKKSDNIAYLKIATLKISQKMKKIN